MFSLGIVSKKNKCIQFATANSITRLSSGIWQEIREPLFKNNRKRRGTIIPPKKLGKSRENGEGNLVVILLSNVVTHGHP
jgi:hypothetical protein